MNLLIHFIKNPISLFRYLTINGMYRYSLKTLLRYKIRNASKLSRKIALGEETEIQFQYKSRNIYMRNEVGVIYYMTQGIKKLEELVAKIDLPSQSIVIDAGGNVGLFTLFLKEKFPDAKIIIIEPSKSLIPILKKNLAIWKDDIIIIEQALSNKNGTVTFYVNKNAEQTNSTDFDALIPFIKDKQDVIEYQVSSINLQSIIKLNNLKKIDLLKIDIQGGEYEVLKASKEVFEKIESLLVEVSFLSKENINLCGMLTDYYSHNQVMGEVKMGADILFAK